MFVLVRLSFAISRNLWNFHWLSWLRTAIVQTKRSQTTCAFTLFKLIFESREKENLYALVSHFLHVKHFSTVYSSFIFSFLLLFRAKPVVTSPQTTPFSVPSSSDKVCLLRTKGRPRGCYAKRSRVITLNTTKDPQQEVVVIDSCACSWEGPDDRLGNNILISNFFSKLVKENSTAKKCLELTKNNYIPLNVNILLALLMWKKLIF